MDVKHVDDGMLRKLPGACMHINIHTHHSGQPHKVPPIENVPLEVDFPLVLVVLDVPPVLKDVPLVLDGFLVLKDVPLVKEDVPVVLNIPLLLDVLDVPRVLKEDVSLVPKDVVDVPPVLEDVPLV